MKIANDNPKLSFLLPLCHPCSLSVIPAKAGIQSWLLWRVRRKRQRHWILVDCLDPRLPTSGTSVEDDRGGKGEDDRGGKGEERGRGQTSRMTEGEKARMTDKNKKTKPWILDY